MKFQLRLLIIAAIATQSVQAQMLQSFRFQVDNDWFDFSMPSVERPDDNYTHGQTARAVLNIAPRWMRFGRPECLETLKVTGKTPACVQSSAAIVNQMYTPTNDSFNPVRGERPYAGILLFEYGRQSVTPHMSNLISGTIGTTGPLSGAEWEQNLFHRLADLRKPLGWNHQIATEPIVGLNYGLQYLLTPPAMKTSFGSIIAQTSAVANNIQMNATAGMEIHAGLNVPHPWMPLSSDVKRPFSAYLILGGNETWVVRNVLLQGNSDETRGLVEATHFVPGSVLGAALGAGGVFLEYRFVGQGRDYKTGPLWHRWGAISIIVGSP
ncbi:MAG TPA: lipid A deacylase LpxR family protein [Gemmatimonadaceae bacterium]|nr:lipid A deacylase LpxR family protein [Gemmatimonadaceae bacterium]